MVVNTKGTIYETKNRNAMPNSRNVICWQRGIFAFYLNKQILNHCKNYSHVVVIVGICIVYLCDYVITVLNETEHFKFNFIYNFRFDDGRFLYICRYVHAVCLDFPDHYKIPSYYIYYTSPNQIGEHSPLLLFLATSFVKIVYNVQYTCRCNVIAFVCYNILEKMYIDSPRIYYRIDYRFVGMPVLVLDSPHYRIVGMPVLVLDSPHYRIVGMPVLVPTFVLR